MTVISVTLIQIQGTFDFVELNKMCWTLCARKNFTNNRMLISDGDAFKIWCIFNFLSEDRYPLAIVVEEVITKKSFTVCTHEFD